MHNGNEVVLPTAYTISEGSQADLPRASVWISSSDKADAISSAQMPIDFAIVLMAGLLSLFLRHGTLEAQPIYWIMWLLGATLHINVAYIFAAYQPDTARSLSTLMSKSIVAWSAASLSIIVIIYFAKVSADFSRVCLVIWFVGSVILMVLSKAIYVGLMMRWQCYGKMATKVALIAPPESADDLLGYFDRFTPAEIAVFSCQDLSPINSASLVAELQDRIPGGKD